MTQIIGHQFAGGADPTAAGGPDGERFDSALPRPERFDIAGGADSRLTAGDQPGGARLLRREEFPVLTRDRALPCAPDGARDDARRGVCGLRAGGGAATLAADADIQIAGGASSSRPAGDDSRLASGNPDAVQPPPASRPECLDLTRERCADVLPACGAAGACAPVGRRIGADAWFGLRPAAVEKPVSIHISADTAALLALLAAERGGTLADAVAWLVVDDINRKGGIAHV